MFRHSTNVASIVSRRIESAWIGDLIKSAMVPPIFQEILWATRRLRSYKDFVDTALPT
jgi:hypothetical protein